MKDKIQILLSMFVCLLMTFSMSAQTYDFNVTQSDISNANPGTNAVGFFCGGGLGVMSADVLT